VGTSGSGTLAIASGATVVSANAGRDAITLRGADIAIDTSANPALVGAGRSVLPTTPSATLTGLDAPSALAVDADGNLYGANFGANGNGTTVSKFVPGSTTPSATLTGLDGPTALAFDAHGNLFVANAGAGTVSKFVPGSTTPSATLTGLDGPSALAFDAHGNLYVANHGVDAPGTTVTAIPPTPTTTSPPISR